MLRTYSLRIVFVSLLFGLIHTAFAQQKELISDIVYGHRDGMAMVYDVAVPVQANGVGIILVVSGGWLSAPDNLNISRPFWEVFLDKGYTVFQLYHPGMPTYQIPDAYDGVQQGVRHILEHADNYGIREEKLGIFGISSGGHLALLAAYDAEVASRVESTEFLIGAVVAIMPPTDLRGEEFDKVLFGASPMDFDSELIPSLSPIDLVSRHSSPTLLIHGLNDAAVNYERNSVRLFQKLEDNNVSSKLVSVDAGHEVFPGPIMETAHSEFLSWFATYLR